MSALVVPPLCWRDRDAAGDLDKPQFEIRFVFRKKFGRR